MTMATMCPSIPFERVVYTTKLHIPIEDCIDECEEAHCWGSTGGARSVGEKEDSRAWVSRVEIEKRVKKLMADWDEKMMMDQNKEV